MNTEKHRRRYCLILFGIGICAVGSARAVDEDHQNRAPDPKPPAREELRKVDPLPEANKQPGNNPKAAIEAEFGQLLQSKRILQQRLIELAKKFRPGNRLYRRTEEQLNELKKREGEMLKMHPELFAKPGNQNRDANVPEDQKAQQGGADQPATRPESKSEGGDKPQPESERRSR